ncbi:Uma2 family endonuclease [Nocardioides humilatus]|uniref:Uma2 family endonuclease n=1 Tax=Nocardioides humilatus TaxID=2607660 RepID=A0A5B1LH87_9ACTN|nr:Uma2 family endonuclease [Nocardioides humilatus]KAA1419160.1 Uma2 family endonuclease [Nocardioides humilatus]
MTVVNALPRRPLTVDDLEGMPDDGHRYELIDGTLIVSPGPAVPHQRVVSRLLQLLFSAQTDEVEVFTAPLDVRLADDTQVQPDILVVAREAAAGRTIEAAPLLAVEVLSPSTKLIDLNLKKARYERAGVASYWVVDPDDGRLIAWELRDGRYAKVADILSGQEWTAAAPFPVTVRPATLSN